MKELGIDLEPLTINRVPHAITIHTQTLVDEEPKNAIFSVISVFMSLQHTLNDLTTQMNQLSNY